jgi:hypothetical protein
MFKQNRRGLDGKVPIIVLGVALIPMGLLLLGGCHRKLCNASSSSPPCSCSSS